MPEPDQKDTKESEALTGASNPDDGVDVSLIRWMLSMSPRQRLLVLQQTANSILRLRNAKPAD